jgi:hypothetical protein
VEVSENEYFDLGQLRNQPCHEATSLILSLVALYKQIGIDHEAITVVPYYGNKNQDETILRWI